MSSAARGGLVGNVKHDDADYGAPIKIGGKASTSTPTAVANGDRVNAYFDEEGRLHVVTTPAATSAGSYLVVNIDDVGSGVCYVGKAAPGTATSAASWQVFRLTEASGDLTMVWADGDADFNNVWDDRASLSYS